MWVSAGLGVLIGAILGMTGAGGGILAVPALTFGMHLRMQQAAPVALIAVALGAAVGTLEGLRHGLVRYKAAALIAISGFPLVYVGQRLAQFLPQALLQAAFASVMLLVAFRLYRQRATLADGPVPKPAARTQIHADSGKFVWTLSTASVLAAIGGLTGLVTGLLGVGGGFVIVPLLRKYTPLPMQGIVASSLMVIALVGASGVASALLQHADIPWCVAATFSATTILGMLLGRRSIKALAPGHVQRGFSVVLTVVAAGLLWQAIRTLLIA